MTENEAIEIITNAVQTENMTVEQDKALSVAQKALEEIQQYRAIGTVEEIKKVVRFLSMDNDNGIIEDLQLLNQYQLIGTVEECREAMEKQKEMKTGEPYMNGYGNTKAECLNCHCTVMYPSNYCKFCGQKLDWSEVN